MQFNPYKSENEIITIMESKVTVLTPNGRRQNVKVTPNTTILQILEEACKKHGFSSDEYCLKHHNKEVSLSQMFRFSGLPNNCLLEMYQTDKKRVAMVVDICVQTEDGSRKQAQFLPDDNLWHVLKEVIGEVELQKFASPVVLYMRQEILGRELLTKTSLKSLGIMEGRALLRLLDKQPEELKTQAMVYKPPAPKVVATTSEADDEKPKTSKSIVPGGSGFAITKDLVQSLKKASANETTETNIESNEVASSKTDKKVENLEPEKPKYDWGSAPGRSMRTSEIKMEVDENENLEPEIEPEYHILGERNALIYSLDSAQNQIEDLPDSFYDLTVNDLKLVLRDLKKIAAGNEDAPLLTEKLRELDDNNTMLRKIAQYKNCVIRIQFPDRHVLQGMFKPIDKISDVKEFTRTYLENGEKPFYLFTIPPKTKLDLNKTLLELDFVPNALVHFSLEDENDKTDKFIHSEFLNKLTPAEGAFYAASKLRQHKHMHNKNVTDVPSPSTGAIPKRPRNDELNNK
ncbi:tether containing UBX domain for GLUT4 isoform X1 [Lucilia cuprina]|uniref:tether containing UBX domain for GLUT4 isoform X1 n=1 Tax=Lucilia cuprina TaxID=7375 RepID=UPI001F05DC0A|nr:tether containing UBX domain for GLUT4 isoform X1 [Lucilia cuprina]